MLTKLTAVETKLFLRDPATPIMVVGLPVGLLLVFSLMPGMNQPSEDFGGRIPLSTLIAPMSVTILLAMLALTVFPAAIAGYREKGVLRRLSASPVSPARLLAAQLAVNLAAVLVVVLLIAGVGRLALGMALPANPAGFVPALVLGTAALFGMGLVIAALAPTGRAGSGIGSAVLFPMLALGGVWVPKEKLPGFLQHVADLLPVGGTLNALRETWSGGSPRPEQLIALAVFAVVSAALAARCFRWE
jgi:ABC-2 type transport system permease protein